MSVSDEKAPLGCCICMEPYVSIENVNKLPCGHLFHRLCITEWTRKGNVSCPLCRGPTGEPCPTNWIERRLFDVQDICKEKPHIAEYYKAQLRLVYKNVTERIEVAMKKIDSF